MTDPSETDPRSIENLDKLDVAYQPFPSFAEWSHATAVDMETWKQHVLLLEETRGTFDAGQLEEACSAVIRAAAFDTGALEGLYRSDAGFTFTVVAHQALAWEQRVQDRSDIALPIFRAQLETYELLLDGATNATPITEVWIRWVHESLCKAYPYYEAHLEDGTVVVRALPLGQYKDMPNHVLQADGTVHAYAPVSDTSPEMARLVSELRSDPFTKAHPCIQAAYAHYCLTVVHPFADGNGRVPRALASTFLFRALSLPFVVLVGHKDEYLASLRSTDLGRFQSFVDFVFQRSLDAVELVLDWLPSRSVPQTSDLADEFRRLLIVKEGLSHDEFDALGGRILNELVTAIQGEISALNLPPGVTSIAQVVQHGPVTPDIPGFRRLVRNRDQRLLLQLASAAPAAGSSTRNIFPFVAQDPRDAALAFRLQVHETGESIELRLAEAHPSITATCRWRLEQFAHRVTGNVGVDVLAQARRSLQSAGYEPA